MQRKLLLVEHVNELEKAMLIIEQVACDVVHRFGPGVYMREVRIPAGTFAVGHFQKTKHTNVMLKGHVTVMNEDGSTSELKAPLMFVGEPGRKIGLVHEDMVWLNIYENRENIQNVDFLEAKFLNKSEGFLLTEKVKEKLMLGSSPKDNQSFEAMLVETGFDAETVREISENSDDSTLLPFGEYKIKVAKSPIEGDGLFATGQIYAGENIAPARISGKRTIAGRFTNHAAEPNAKMIRLENGDIHLIAVKDIAGCRGGFNGEEITIDYREALKINLGGTACQQ